MTEADDANETSYNFKFNQDSEQRNFIINHTLLGHHKYEYDVINSTL
jgi:hypothetical protein